MKKHLLRMWLAVIALLFSVNVSAVTETYDFVALINGGYTTINNSGTKSFEGKSLNVISSFTNSTGTVGANVGGRIAALYQNGNGNNFWMRDASRPWFVSAGKTSYMAFDNLKAGDVVKIIGGVFPLTILCDNVQDTNGNDVANGTTFNATYAEDAPLTLVAKADGYIYGSYGPYTAIKKIIVETSAAETANDPVITITGANDNDRTVTINPNTGSIGSEQTAYYTLDGSDPSNASTKYTDPITISQTTTLKAISYCGEAASNIVTLEVEAGTTIALNQPVLNIVNMADAGENYSPIYKIIIDNSNLIGNPTATLTAVFDGNDVSNELKEGSFIPATNGTLTATVSAEGYESCSINVPIYYQFKKVYGTADYGTLVGEEAVKAVIGENWTSTTTRWANWNKMNATYGESYIVYSYSGEEESNIYIDKDEKLRANKAIQFVEGFGFGRGVSSSTPVFINNTGTANDITLYRVNASKGADEENFINTYVISDENGYSTYNIPSCTTLCQATIYSPILPTYTATFVNGAKWENVYAYTWTGDTPNKAWPGEKIEKSGTKTINDVEYDVYTFTIQAEVAPANIIFNNGDGIQTADLVFEDGKEYSYGVPTVETVEKFYIMGSGTPNLWSTTTEMTFNTETAAFEYTIEDTGTLYFTFGDAEFTDWDDFNGNHRYAIGSGDKDATVGEAMQLVKVNGTLVLPAGKYNISVAKADLKCTITKVEPEVVLNTYTATFTTNAGWGEVYAYAWTTEGENTTEFLGAWPGTKLEDNEGVYTATIEAAAAPAYIIFNNGMGAQTADLEFEDGKAYEFKISDEWAAAIAAAAAEAEEDGVAVGKLIEAIAKAQGQTGTDEEKAALQAAVDQYKADNASQETDLTSQFSALTDWQKWTGATGYTATNYCPTVDINDGTKKQVCEKYETTCATTGDIFYQTVTGLTTGTYKIELYGGAAFTFGRGFGSMAFTGEIGTGDAWGTHNSETYTAGQHIDTETGVKMYAITSEGTYEEEIPIYYATNFPDGAATVVLDGVKVGVNGEVKIGMNKTSQSTNWHVVQLKGVTAQVLAKDLYAAHQTELQALVAEAQALAADENKTEGKDVFQEALTTAELAVNSQWYNNAEIEGIINNLKNAIANFKKANYFIDFAAGEYYVIDAESGKMMAAGHDYGTRGILNETGLDLTLTPYTESRTVTIDSRVSNGENNHFLGQNMYMDSSEWGFALEYQGFAFYILEPNSEKYINIDENDNLVLSDTPREFIIVTKDGVMEQRMDELADATETNPVDATFLLQNPNFNRNDQRVSAWEWIPSETAEENDNWDNHNFNGGNQVNNCAESYHAAFVVKQTVSGAPAGKYTMTAQGFYRQDAFEGDAPAAPMFFANGVNKDVPAKTGEENSMSKASESFTSGLYTIEPVEFEVADDGMIYVGVTAAVHNQWVIFDNFQLKYYGKKDITDGISTIETEALKGNVYNLQGQKVEKAVKGLYIVNGKKVVKK